MASAKIATLVIRTLAKPIATQLKQQASQHETFRKLCISLAQFMHRTELRLRQGLGPASAGGQKVRPLNDAKAIANGANSLSEGFLFLVAAGLILGESYRGSRSRARQRDSTEAAVEEVRVMVETLSSKLGIRPEDLKPVVVGKEGPDGDEEEHFVPQGDTDQVEVQPATQHISSQSQQAELEHLRAAVRVLLQMALREGWVGGEESLRLEQVLRGEGEYESGGTAESASVTSAQQGARKSVAQGSSGSVLDILAQQSSKSSSDGSSPATIDPSAGPSAALSIPLTPPKSKLPLSSLPVSPILRHLATMNTVRVLSVWPSASPSILQSFNHLSQPVFSGM